MQSCESMLRESHQELSRVDLCIHGILDDMRRLLFGAVILILSQHVTAKRWLVRPACTKL